jgi:hypothetical protein
MPTNKWKFRFVKTPMALVPCSECGNQVSDKASACPKCGCPVPVGTAAAAPEYRCKICGHTSDTNIRLCDHVRMTHMLIGSKADEQMEVPLREKTRDKIE